MHEELRKLSSDIRRAVAEELCVEFGFDEDDLRSILREEIRIELKDSIVADTDEVLKEHLLGEIKNEVYETVHDEIYHECFGDLLEHYHNDQTFISEVQRELREELKEEVFDQLRFELRNEVLDTLTAEMRTDPITMSQIKERLTAEIYHEIRNSLREA